MRSLLLATCLVLALALTACGSDEGGGGGAAEKTPVGPNTVVIKDIKFDPTELKVKVGDTVTWVNQEEVEHNAVDEKTRKFKSEDFGLDGTYEYKTTEAGTIEYVCTLHPGMDGTLVVE